MLLLRLAARCNCSNWEWIGAKADSSDSVFASVYSHESRSKNNGCGENCCNAEGVNIRKRILKLFITTNVYKDTREHISIVKVFSTLILHKTNFIKTRASKLMAKALSQTGFLDNDVDAFQWNTDTECHFFCNLMKIDSFIPLVLVN